MKSTQAVPIVRAENMPIERLKSIMELLDYTPEKLCEKTGMPRDTFEKIIKGEKIITKMDASLLCPVIGGTISYWWKESNTYIDKKRKK